MKYKLVDGQITDEDGNAVNHEDLTQEESLTLFGIKETSNDDADDVADTLTTQNLETTLKNIIDEKLTLAETSQDDEDEEHQEEEKKEKGIGLFPILLIGGIVAVGAFALFAKNSPASSPEQTEEVDHG